MKHWTLALFVIVSAAIARAETLNEVDYPIQYEVVNTNAVHSWMIGNFCTMALRDQANKAMVFIVQKRGHGDCHIPDSGTSLHGRRDKNEIRLLVHDASGKLTIVRWPIVGTSETSKGASK